METWSLYLLYLLGVIFITGASVIYSERHDNDRERITIIVMWVTIITWWLIWNVWIL